MLLRKKHLIMGKSKRSKKKARYKVTNWPFYNKSLVKRGSIILWVDDDLFIPSQSPVKKSRGRPFSYSDGALLHKLTLSVCF